MQRRLGAASIALSAMVWAANAAAQVVAMGKLSEYTKAIFDCPGISVSILGFGPSSFVERSTSMEPVEVCLYDHEARKGLKFKIPAAYIDGGTRDEHGRLYSLRLQFWLPGFQPPSAIPVSNEAPDSENRLQYMQKHQLSQMRFSVRAEWRGQGHDDTMAKVMRDGYKWELLPDLALEHYTFRCESIDAMKKAGRDFPVRRCDESSSTDTYIGYSKISNGRLHIACGGNVDLCQASSNFKGHEMDFRIPRKEVRRVKEFEQAINQFLNKYLVEIVQ